MTCSCCGDPFTWPDKRGRCPLCRALGFTVPPGPDTPKVVDRRGRRPWDVRWGPRTFLGAA